MTRWSQCIPADRDAGRCYRKALLLKSSRIDGAVKVECCKRRGLGKNMTGLRLLLKGLFRYTA